MGAHIVDGEFQSDKYPTTPRSKVPLSVKDPAAQDLLWEYAQRRRAVDAEFSEDLEAALKTAGYSPVPTAAEMLKDIRETLTDDYGPGPAVVRGTTSGLVVMRRLSNDEVRSIARMSGLK